MIRLPRVLACIVHTRVVPPARSVHGRSLKLRVDSGRLRRPGRPGWAPPRSTRPKGPRGRLELFKPAGTRKDRENHAVATRILYSTPARRELRSETVDRARNRLNGASVDGLMTALDAVINVA
jgi:hypothetical protein